jgi:hypothetical protein
MPVHKLRVEYRAYAVHLLLKPLGLLLEMSLYRNRIYVRFIQREKLKRGLQQFHRAQRRDRVCELRGKGFQRRDIL